MLQLRATRNLLCQVIPGSVSRGNSGTFVFPGDKDTYRAAFDLAGKREMFYQVSLARHKGGPACYQRGSGQACYAPLCSHPIALTGVFFERNVVDTMPAYLAEPP
jgi:hypothetical protein